MKVQPKTELATWLWDRINFLKQQGQLPTGGDYRQPACERTSKSTPATQTQNTEVRS